MVKTINQILDETHNGKNYNHRDVVRAMVSYAKQEREDAVRETLRTVCDKAMI